MMKNKFYNLLALVALITGAAHTAAAQNMNDNLSARLPASDAVVMIDAKRVLGEALPRALASDPPRLAKINADIDNFRTRTGINPRDLQRVAIGMKFVPAAGGTRVETVALASGSFNPSVITAAARLASNGKYREEKYAGKSVSIFTLSEQIKMLGVLNIRAGEIAFAPLDNNTLAIGDLSNVRAAIDAAAGRNRVSAEVLNLASRHANALVSFGGNVPQSFVANLEFPNEEIKRALASVRQGYGAINMSAKGFEVVTTARTDNADAAQSLGNTIEAVRQFAPFLINMMRGEQKELARVALDNLKVSTTGNEVNLRLEMSDANIALLIPQLFRSTTAQAR